MFRAVEAGASVVEHGERVRRHPLGHRHVARVPVRTHAEPHRRAALDQVAAVHREFADLLGREGQHAVPDDSQRRGRCGAVVPGDRVLLGARGGWARKPRCSTSIPRSTACASARTRSTGPSTWTSSSTTTCSARPTARVDGQGRAVPRTRQAGRGGVLQEEVTGRDWGLGTRRWTSGAGGRGFSLDGQEGRRAWRGKNSLVRPAGCTREDWSLTPSVSPRFHIHISRWSDIHVNADPNR